MADLSIIIASDHGGFEQKELLKDWLKQQGYNVFDCGCYSDESVDYPDLAKAACDKFLESDAQYVILVCGTGIGMQISANKVDGIRAANVTSPKFAALARQHNNANVLTLSGRFVDIDTNKDIITTFIETEFEGGRHARRVEKIMNIE